MWEVRVWAKSWERADKDKGNSGLDTQMEVVREKNMLF